MPESLCIPAPGPLHSPCPQSRMPARALPHPRPLAGMALCPCPSGLGRQATSPTDCTGGNFALAPSPRPSLHWACGFPASVASILERERPRSWSSAQHWRRRVCSPHAPRAARVPSRTPSCGPRSSSPVTTESKSPCWRLWKRHLGATVQSLIRGE